jgi:copper oxidase (laccase) domain-containing protein
MVSGVVANAVRMLREAHGTQPSDVLAALGPAIGPCCYEVGPEVTGPVRRVLGSDGDLLQRQSDGRMHFDLSGAVRAELTRLGLSEMEDCGLCTACRTDEFFSHRAEAGQTGRFAVMTGLRGTGAVLQAH